MLQFWGNQMRAQAVVRLEFPSERHLEIVLKALEPEVKRPASVRSRGEFMRDGACLVLKVEARDTVALRAALNAYLRWINSTINVLKTLDTL